MAQGTFIDQHAEPVRTPRKKPGLCHAYAVTTIAGSLLLAATGALVTPLASAQSCGNLLTGETGGSFGSIATNTRENLQQPAMGGYFYGGSGPNSLVREGSYVVVSRNGSDAIHPSPLGWKNLFGHNGGNPADPNDAYLAVNGSGAVGIFFRQSVTLNAGEQYRLSLWGVNAVSLLLGNPQIVIRILGPNNTILATANSGVLPARNRTFDSPWREAAIDFNSGAGGTFRVEVLNGSTEASGNDFALDDVSVSPLREAGCPSDFGDAPDLSPATGPGDYQTLAGNGGPQHALVAGLFIGVAATSETNGQPSAASNADVDDGIAGTVPDVPGLAGANYSLTVAVNNTTGTPATLAGFIDFNQDGDFEDLGERAVATVLPFATTATLNFTVPAGTVIGTTVLRLRIASIAAQVATALGIADSGEVEDYPIAIRPSLRLAKTWIGATVGHAATITATGLPAFTSIAQTPGETNTGPARPVVTGANITLAETFGGGAIAAQYLSALACTGAQDTDLNDGLTVNSQDLAIVCTFTNTRRSANVEVTKTNTPASGPNDRANDTVVNGSTTTYTIVASNVGPNEGDGAVLTDQASPSINCTAAQCTSVSGGAVCPGGGAPPRALSVATLQGAGLAIPTFPANSSVTVTLTCEVALALP